MSFGLMADTRTRAVHIAESFHGPVLSRGERSRSSLYMDDPSDSSECSNFLNRLRRLYIRRRGTDYSTWNSGRSVIDAPRYFACRRCLQRATEAGRWGMTSSNTTARRIRGTTAMSQQRWRRRCTSTPNNCVLLLNGVEAAGFRLEERRRYPTDRRRHLVTSPRRACAPWSRADRALEELEDDVLARFERRRARENPAAPASTAGWRPRPSGSPPPAAIRPPKPGSGAAEVPSALDAVLVDGPLAVPVSPCLGLGPRLDERDGAGSRCRLAHGRPGNSKRHLRGEERQQAAMCVIMLAV